MDGTNTDHLNENQIAAWIERRLTPGATKSVEQHLADCDECRNVLAAYARTDTIIKDEIDSAVPIKHRNVSVWLAIAAILLAALAAFVFYRISQKPVPDPSLRTREDQKQQPKAQQEQDQQKPEVIAELKPDDPSPIEKQPSGQIDPSLLPKRGSLKKIDSKVFRFRAGIWVDTEYKPGEFSLLEVRKGSEEYQRLILRYPDLQEYSKAGKNVIVVL
jgi:hypothetical protein